MTARDVLHLFKNVRRVGDNWTARCPTHDDEKNSLSIGDGRDGQLLLHCHANVGCTYAGICAATGIERLDSAASDERRVETIYDYTDETGTLLYQNVRFEPKDFRQRRPDGQGGYVWKLNGVRRVPYCLPQLLAAASSAEIFLTEGEEDADNLRRHGLIVSSFKNWKAEFSRYVSGRDVRLLRDHDESGVKQAEEAARLIVSEAKTIKVIDFFPDELLPEKHGKDVSDWLAAGGTVDQLKAIVETAPLWKPDNASAKAQAKREIRFTFTTLDDLLAEPEEETAYVWDNTLPRGGFSICAAKPKVGKSTLSA